MVWTLKLDENKNAVLKDGVPLYVNSEGEEQTFDGPKLYATVDAVRGERDTARTEASEVKQALASFGATPDERKKALDRIELAKNIDAGKLIGAEQIEEKVRERVDQATKKFNTEKETFTRREQALLGKVADVMVNSEFHRVDKILDKTLLTPSLARAVFRQHFAVKESESGFGLVPFHDPEHQRVIYSGDDGNKVAGFDEALKILYNAHPERKAWTRGTNATGGEAPGGGGEGGDGKTMSRADFSKLPPNKKSELSLSGIQLVD